MFPLRVIVCVWTITFVVGSRESPISCQLNGQQLRYNQTIHYEYGNQSIVVCRAPKKFALEHGVTNTSGMLKKIHGVDEDYHVIGIPLSHAPDHVQLHTVRSDGTIGRGFRLNFVGSPGHQPEMCRVVMPNSSTKAQSSSKVQNGPIQCWLNNEPLMNLSTIHVTKGCQLNIVKCSVDQTNLHLVGNFRPQRHHISAAWIPYDGTGPPHIVMLQLKDLISDSATSTEVRMNAVFMLGSKPNESPFPFVFTVTVTNEATDPIPDTTTATMNDNIVTTPPTTAPMPIISSDSNKGLKPEEITGSVVSAVLVVVGLLVAVAVGVFVYCVRNRKTEESTKSKVDMSTIEEGVAKGDEVHNQSQENMLPSDN